MVFLKESTKKHSAYISSLNYKHIEIKPFKKTRSNSQNALYWACLSLIANKLDCSKEALHESVKEGFLGYKKEVIFDKVVYIPESTKSLNVEQFTELLQKVFLLADKYEVELPDLREFGL